MNKIIKLSIISASILTCLHANADQKFQDDLIVVGSGCFGLDCVNGESFGFDTIRLKENNLRIRAIDSSNSSSFPTVDWQLTFNDSANGGVNHFSIEDLDSGTVPFSILSSAPTNSLYVASNGNIGVGTSTPLVDVSVKSGNTPTLRLEQDGSSGFAAQAWDIGGNEANFFVRDVTNGSQLPLRIVPNAPNGSLYIAADGDVGFETTTPDGQFDIAHSGDANNHALLVSPVSYVGVNIDNGQVPLGQFDVQSTGGVSNFLVNAAGNVGIGAGTSGAINGRFEIKSQDATNTYFNVDATGNVGIGTNAPNALLEIEGSNANILITDNDTQATADVRSLLNLSSEHGSNIKFSHRNNSNKNWTIGTYSSGNGFMISRADTIDNNSDVYDNYNLLLNDDLFIIQDTSANKLMTLDNTQLKINGTFVSSSSRTVKDNIIPVNPESILEILSELVIKKWNYSKDEAKVQHIGPIAEEFYELFGLGADDKYIASLDTSGIALAAIQALNNDMKNKDSKIKALENKNNILMEKIQEIENTINNLLSN